jgi:serine/threonine-protein kinase
MAEVFRALDQPPAGAPRAVVIKRMLPALAADTECRRMFQDEARLGLRVQHDNVVQAISAGFDGTTPYIVLEYVFGVDLWRVGRHLTRSGSKLRLPVAMYVVTEMLSGLEAVHAVTDDDGNPLHIVHRDVSPSNVFLSVHGDVKLGDLGIAGAAMRETHPTAPRNTRAKGKLGYLAPEQIAGQQSDQRADVFAAGVIAAELILGKPLFTGGGEIGILLAIRDGDIKPFREMAPSLPAELALALMGALERSPEVRTETAADLRQKLLPFVDESVQTLRRELGAIVARVLSETEDGQPQDRRALAKTVERGADDWMDSSTPAVVDDQGRLHVQSDAGDLVPVENPAALDQSVYVAQSIEGRPLGTFKYAGLVEAIATGRVGAGDSVSIDSAELRPLLSYPALVRHLPPSSRTPTLQRRTRMVETNELYDLSRGGMLAVLARALVDGVTGLLLCEHDTVRKEIYLEDGGPAYVASNRASDLLGEYLVARGVIERAELDMALAVMPRFEGRLGETLAALGLVEPVHLVRHIAAQVRERLLETFTWPAGRAAFYAGVDPPEGRVPHEIDAWGILATGAGMRIELGLENDRFGGRDGGSLLRVGQAADDVLALCPPSDVVFILGMLEQPQPLARMDEIVPNPDGTRPTHGRRLVTVLLAMDAARWA